MQLESKNQNPSRSKGVDAANLEIFRHFLLAQEAKGAQQFGIKVSKLDDSTFLIRGVNKEPQVYLRLVSNSRGSGVEWSLDRHKWESVRKVLGGPAASEFKRIVANDEYLKQVTLVMRRSLNGLSSVALPPAAKLGFEDRIELFKKCAADCVALRNAGRISDQELLKSLSFHAHRIFLGVAQATWKQKNQTLLEAGVILLPRLSVDQNSLDEVALITTGGRAARVVDKKELSTLFSGLVAENVRVCRANVESLYVSPSSDLRHRVGDNPSRVGIVIPKALGEEDLNLIFPKRVEAETSHVKANTLNCFEDIMQAREISLAAASLLCKARDLSLINQNKFSQTRLKLASGLEFELPEYDLQTVIDSSAEIAGVRLSSRFSGAFIASLLRSSRKEEPKLVLCNRMSVTSMFLGIEQYLISESEQLDASKKGRLEAIILNGPENIESKAHDLYEIMSSDSKLENLIEAKYREISDSIFKKYFY